MFKFGLKRGLDAKLKFGSYVNTAELPLPGIFGYGCASPQLKKPVYLYEPGMLGNATWGDCVWAGAAHEVMYWEASAGKHPARFTTGDCLGDYAVVTGFNYTEDTDQGTDMVLAAKYRQQTGNRDAANNRHKIDVYADLKEGDVNQVALATYLTGVAGVGVEIYSSDMDQFRTGRPFDIQASQGKLEGEHYIPILGRNSHCNFLCITWGRLQALTSRWLAERMNQGLVYIDRETLNAKGLNPLGFDFDRLTKDFNEVVA